MNFEGYWLTREENPDLFSSSFISIAQRIQVLPYPIRNRRHISYRGHMHAMVLKCIQRELDVEICAIKVVGDNRREEAACTILRVDAFRNLREAVGDIGRYRLIGLCS